MNHVIMANSQVQQRTPGMYEAAYPSGVHPRFLAHLTRVSFCHHLSIMQVRHSLIIYRI